MAGERKRIQINLKLSAVLEKQGKMDEALQRSGTALENALALDDDQNYDLIVATLVTYLGLAGRVGTSVEGNSLIERGLNLSPPLQEVNSDGYLRILSQLATIDVSKGDTRAALSRYEKIFEVIKSDASGSTDYNFALMMAYADLLEKKGESESHMEVLLYADEHLTG